MADYPHIPGLAETKASGPDKTKKRGALSQASAERLRHRAENMHEGMMHDSMTGPSVHAPIHTAQVDQGRPNQEALAAREIATREPGHGAPAWLTAAYQETPPRVAPSSGPFGKSAREGYANRRASEEGGMFNDMSPAVTPHDMIGRDDKGYAIYSDAPLDNEGLAPGTGDDQARPTFAEAAARRRLAYGR